MKKFILLIFIINLNLFASDIQAAYAIGIFHENGMGENIQHKRITEQDYNKTCFSKIVIFGNYSLQSKIEVKVGDSLGYFVSKIPIYNKYKIKIGDELTFKHNNITKGYFEVRIDGKLYDTKVLIK
jgi:hypothetical protein